MGLDWTDLFAALAIVCIIEGIMPFINPLGMKRLLSKLAANTPREEKSTLTPSSYSESDLNRFLDKMPEKEPAKK